MNAHLCGLMVGLRVELNLKRFWNPHEHWRRDSESNRGTRICNPLHNHSAIAPAGACVEAGAH